MKRKGLYILSYASALLASAVVLLFRSKPAASSALIAVLAVFATLVFLFAIQVFSAKRFLNQINRSKVADLNDFLVSHRNDAEKTAKEKRGKLRRIRRFTAVYTLFIAALGIAIAVLGGSLVSVSSTLYTVCLLCSGLVLLSVYARIHKKRPLTLGEDAVSVSPDDYPLIYALARRAADSVGYENEIVILLTWDCTAGIVNDQKKAFLQIGVVVLHVLSEEELYAVLLHEFAHISDNASALREERYNAWLCDGGGAFDRLSDFLSNLYVDLARKYIFHYTIYQYASAVTNELNADQAMAKRGDAKIAVSALLKIHYDSMYFWESCVKNTPSIYESEELKADYLTNKIAAFQRAISERSNDWNQLVDKEILANNSTHPTLKMRMDALGIHELALAETKSSEGYLAETQRILEFSENKIYEERLKTYEKDRKEQFLEPLNRIEAWNRAGKPISAETYADLVSDLKILGRHEEAEALCDTVLEQLPALSTAHAAFMKGAALLYRYDENGMELIYRAMEQNGNYIQEGLDIVGAFCCLTGREKELPEYRQKAAQLAQKHRDADEQISFLSKNDRLTRESLPDGMLEDILAFIVSVDQDIIQNIYLVRKTVSETFFSSVFIIHFYGGTDAQRNEVMHKIFRYLDSYPSERQFSLFDYFEYPEIQVEKIEGSLVYSKNKNT